MVFEHVDELKLLAALQPAKTEPPEAVAVKVTNAPLSLVVMLGKHVLVTVCEACAVPVPPQLVGALIVPTLGVMANY